MARLSGQGAEDLYIRLGIRRRGLARVKEQTAGIPGQLKVGVVGVKINVGMVQRMLLDHPYIDFYAYDTNLQLARYASSLFFHAGKTAATYSETNIQVLSTLSALPGHLAILISHTGENGRLIELARLLRRGNTRTIVITSGKDTTLGRMADEFLYAPIALGMDRMWSSTFFTAAKYLLDLMYAIVFCSDYNSNMALNQRYEAIGAATFWGLNSQE